MTYLLLFWEFFKTGLLSVGGGLSTLPFLTEMSQKHGWFTLAELADMVAVAESTPGPIGVNTATYAGFHVAGIPGALLATLALILPSFIIIFFISKCLEKYIENRFVKRVFYALRAAVVGLIAAAGLSVIKMALYPDGITAFADLYNGINIKTAILFTVILICTQIKQLKKLHPLVYIGVGAVAGIFIL
ncbi:MAG: chromate transporter [Christensenellaceae bacterium]|nr:chromate transporter [Christensenellaceae bacterium]